MNGNNQLHYIAQLQSKILSKIGFSHFLVIKDVLGGPLSNNVPFTNYVGMLADV